MPSQILPLPPHVRKDRGMTENQHPTDNTEHVNTTEPQPLAGRTIAITASRRVAEQAEAYTRRGATVFLAPTVRIVRTDDDEQLESETRTFLASPPNVFLVATGYGLNSWLDAAENYGLREQVLTALVDAEILVRGAKGRGAVRALGLEDQGMVAIETTESLVELAIECGVAGKTVAIQQHGKPGPALTRRLEEAGATVTEVRPNRWEEPLESELVEELIRRLIAGEIDAVTFTAAPAAECLLDRARELSVFDELTEALKTQTVVVVVGPVTAEPFDALEIPVVAPERFRMGAMVKELVSALSR